MVHSDFVNYFGLHENMKNFSLKLNTLNLARI